MKNYALVLGAVLGPDASVGRDYDEHRIAVYEGTDALYIPVNGLVPLVDAITSNFWFRSEAPWSRIFPERDGDHPTQVGYAISQVARVKFALDSLGEFTDEEGVVREIVYFTVGDKTSRRIMKDNLFGWKYKASVILSMATLLQDSSFSRYMTDSSPERRGNILPVLKKIYEGRGWK